MSSTVTICGNATADPELRTTGNGTSVCRLGVAVERRKKNAAGEWESIASFFDATCWKELAEHVAGSVRKGDRVVVTGRLEQRTFTDRNNTERTVVEIVADDVGVSLLRTTADVARTARRGPSPSDADFPSEPF